jgi:hypothetical protein
MHIVGSSKKSWCSPGRFIGTNIAAGGSSKGHIITVVLS